MQVNRVKGVVERYVGEVAGADRWETVYDPKSDGVSIFINERSRINIWITKSLPKSSAPLPLHW